MEYVLEPTVKYNYKEKKASKSVIDDSILLKKPKLGLKYISTVDARTVGKNM